MPTLDLSPTRLWLRHKEWITSSYCIKTHWSWYHSRSCLYRMWHSLKLDLNLEKINEPRWFYKHIKVNMNMNLTSTWKVFQIVSRKGRFLWACLVTKKWEVYTINDISKHALDLKINVYTSQKEKRLIECGFTKLYHLGEFKLVQELKYHDVSDWNNNQFAPF